jgi:hypothetical protein
MVEDQSPAARGESAQVSIGRIQNGCEPLIGQAGITIEIESVVIPFGIAVDKTAEKTNGKLMEACVLVLPCDPSVPAIRLRARRITANDPRSSGEDEASVESITPSSTPSRRSQAASAAA